MYKLYNAGAFESLIIDETAEPELAKFVNQTNTKGPKFSNYSSEKLEYFVDKIYELRKDNTNNPA